MNLADSDIRSRLLMARLPAMPQILLKLLELCQSDDTGLSEIASLVAKDPGITCKIMALANSSAFHRGGAKVGLEQSVATIGTDMIKTLVISESVFQVFNGFSHSTGTDLRSFWKHSITAAIVAREIAQKTGYPNLEEAYLSGLLHDVGRLALLSAAAKEYAYVFFTADDDNLCAIEQSTLNLTHTEAGAWLIERWNLDSFISDSVLYHHEKPERLADAHPLVRIILLSNLLGIHAKGHPSLQEAAETLDLDIATLDGIVNAAGVRVAKLAEMLDIDLTGADDLVVPAASWEIAGKIAGLEEAATANGKPAKQSEMIATPQEVAQRQLSGEIHNMMLAQHVQQGFESWPRDAAELSETIVKAAHVLFDLVDVVILQIDASAKHLVGLPVGETRQRIKELVFPLQSNNPIVIAAHARNISFLPDAAVPSIMEEQMLRLLGSEAFICIPMTADKACQGLLIGGIGRWQIPMLRQRDRLLMLFADQVAVSLLKGSHQARPPGPEAQALQHYQASSRGMVHEVNNALSIIRNYLGVIDARLEQQNLETSEISILNQELDRVGTLLSDFTESGKSDHGGFAEVNRIAEEVTRLFRRGSAVSSEVQITTRLTESPSEIAIGPGPLKQILINLVKNATEAMNGKGEIQLINNGRVNRDGALYNEICIRDNGPGLPQEIMANLFRPGFSTKDKSAHQGLGLSIVYDLVKKSNGLISCRSNASGTSFELLFPVRNSS